MEGTGILAYGSLIGDPGAEIAPRIARRIDTFTPFPVEYARLSQSRGLGPTVVPHRKGGLVKAQVLVLDNSVSLSTAQGMLWRRERRREGSGEKYEESHKPNAVLVRDETGFCGLGHVLYTDFNAEGKIEHPDPEALAEKAIASVSMADRGKDGISYLLALLNAGVETRLTPAYRDQILAQTQTTTLADALRVARARAQKD